MKKSHTIGAALLSLALLGSGFAVPAEAAEQTPPPKPLNIMVVDIQTLLQKSKAAQMVRQQIEEKRTQYTKEIAATEQRLNKEKETLQREQARLSPAALNERETKFQKELSAFKANYKGKVQALQESSSQAFRKIQQAMLRIIAKYAKNRKANIVFPRSELLLFDKSFDVTDEVLNDLNKEMPALTVSFAKPAGPPTGHAAPPTGHAAAPRRKK